MAENDAVARRSVGIHNRTTPPVFRFDDFDHLAPLAPAPRSTTPTPRSSFPASSYATRSSPDLFAAASSASAADDRRSRMLLSLAASSSSVTMAAAAAQASAGEEEARRRRRRERGAAARRAAERSLRRAIDGSALLRSDYGTVDGVDDDAAAAKNNASVSRRALEEQLLLRGLAPSVPRVRRADVVVGRLLGRGGFSDVYEVKSLGSEAASSVATAAAAVAAAAALALNEEKEEEKEHEGNQDDDDDNGSIKCSELLDTNFSNDESTSLAAAAAAFPSRRSSAIFSNRRSSAAAAGRQSRRSSAIIAAARGQRRSSAAAVPTATPATAGAGAGAAVSAGRRGSGATTSRRRSSIFARRRRSSAAATRRRSSAAAARRDSSAATSLSLQDVFHENSGTANNNINLNSSHHSKRRSLNGSLRDMAKKCVEVVTMCSRRTSSFDMDFLDEDDDGGCDTTSAPTSASAPKYALKQLSPSTWDGDLDTLRNGAGDLALEAALLSALRHPHLIRLHGVAEGGCDALEESLLGGAGHDSNRYNTNFGGFDYTTTSSHFTSPTSTMAVPAPFFLILDRLSCTLEDTIYGEWTDRMLRLRQQSGIKTTAAVARGRSSRRGLLAKQGSSKKSSASAASASVKRLASITTDYDDDDHRGDDEYGASAAARRFFLAERLSVARDVASALAYLHGRKVLHRDVKPDNVGFDGRGNVKLFDLGLAKELKPSAAAVPAAIGGHACKASSSDDESPLLYNLTGRTGSRPYMSPEVGLSRPYGVSADAYSFSVLLWEVCALRRPFGDMTRSEHERTVLRGYVRPDSPDLRARAAAKCKRRTSVDSEDGNGRRGVGIDDPDDGDDHLWSDEVRTAMGCGWDPECLVRPSLGETRDVLGEESRRLGGVVVSDAAAAAAASVFEEGDVKAVAAAAAVARNVASSRMASSSSSAEEEGGRGGRRSRSPSPVMRVTRSALAA